MRRNLFLITTLLLFPIAAIAQTKPTAEIKNLVTIKADFVLLKATDLDARGLNFDLVPLVETGNQAVPVPQRNLGLKYATGYPTTLLYRDLSQMTPVSSITRRFVSAPVVSTPDNVAVTITVDGDVPNFTETDLVSGIPTFLPQVKERLQIQGCLTLTPHINANHSITLGYSLPPEFVTLQSPSSRVVSLRPIASGATLVVGGLQYPALATLALSSAELLHLSNWVLLIFITPKIAP